MVLAEDSEEEGIDEKRISCTRQPFAQEGYKIPPIRRLDIHRLVAIGGEPLCCG